MSRHRIICFILIVLLIAIFYSGCDDYNIVEPRFYEGEYIKNMELITGETTIYFAIPEASVIGLYLIGSAGEVIEVIYEGYLSAGIHSFEFDWRDENGDKYPDGIYCFFLRADEFKRMDCFEYDDPEDYLP